MKLSMLLRPAILVVTIALWSVSVGAAEDVASLLRLVPPSSNTLVVVRVRELLETPRAKREGWKEETLKFLAGADTVPAWVDALVLGAQLHPSGADNWSASVLYCPGGVSLEEMAKSERRDVQQVGGVPAMHTHRDAYFLQLKPDVLGVMSPALRQEAARWARTAVKATKPQLSEFLNQAAVAPSHIVMAIDMQDMLDPQLIRHRLAVTESLKGKAAVIDTLDKLFRGLRGVAFYAQIDDDTDARIELTFSDDLPGEADQLKALFLDMMSDERLALEDFRDGKATVRGAVLTVNAKLSDPGLRRILSLILTPYPASAQSSGGLVLDALGRRSVEPSAQPRLPAETMRTDRNYYVAVVRALTDLQSAATWSTSYAETAGWLERYALKIDNLPRTGVDENLTNYAADVASKLRALASTTWRMVVDVNAAESTLTYRTDVAYPPYGAYGYGWGWGMAPRWSVTSNLAEVRAEQAQAIKNTAKQCAAIRQYLLEQTAAIRHRMEVKYGPEFSSGIQ